MVDMQIGVDLQALCNEIDEALERTPFLLSVGSPIADVLDGSVLVRVEIPEQEFESAVADKRVALEIEEQVALVRIGQKG